MALGHQDHSAQDSVPVPTGDLLTSIRDLDKAADQADRDRFIAIAEWAERHTTGALLPDLYGTFGLPDDDAHTEAENAWVSRFGMPGADTMLELAGPGAPEISEFAVIELAAALGRSTDSGRMLLSDAVEARYRLPKVWQRLLDGQVQVWRVRRVTDLTRALSQEAAAFVDAHLAHVVHTASFTTVKRLVAEAAARFDPEGCEMEEIDTAATLHVTLDLATAWSIGTANGVHLSGLLDRADAEELEHAIRTIADQLAAAGSQDCLDVRRAKALGYLSRGDLTLDLASSVEEARQRRLETTKPTRQVVLPSHAEQRCEEQHVHASNLLPMIDAALASVGWQASDLEAVAVCAGPGSYTGLRIGTSTAKGICHAHADTDDGPRPYLHVRRGLEALIARSVYYELMNLALEDGGEPVGLWSHGTFFPLDRAR